MLAGRKGDPRGKLKALAARWAGGRGGAVMADDVATANAKLPAWMKRKEETDEIQLLPDEADTAQLFLALGTQWRRHAMTGMCLGLDYGVIPPTAQMLGIALDPARFLDLRMMEQAALDQIARKAAR